MNMNTIDCKLGHGHVLPSVLDDEPIVAVTVGPGNYLHATPAQARALASELLAAADEAEGRVAPAGFDDLRRALIGPDVR